MNKTSVIPPLSHRYILGTRVDATSYGDAAARIVQWAQAGESRHICACNVHMVMEAHDVEDFQRVVNAADLVTPDGMPLVWVLRRLGLKNQARVYGPDLTLAMCAAAAAAGIPVGLYGGTQEALDTLQTSYRAQFPQLQITYAYSPPFRPMTREEDDAVVQAINASGARILGSGPSGRRAGRDVGGRRGFRLSLGPGQTGPAMDAAMRFGMAVPPAHGSASAVATLFQEQPALSLVGHMATAGGSR